MTCGIYLLRFNGTKAVYVGQSINIEERYSSHIRCMRAKTTSHKLQYAYDTYGIPTLEILIECDKELLNETENEAIAIFNSVENGFNTLSNAEDLPTWKNRLKGEDSPTAIYSNEQILSVIKLMCNPNLTLLKISEISGVKYSTIKKISQGVQHAWVQEKFPDLWNTMITARELRTDNNHKNRHELLKDKFCAKSQGIAYPKVISPTGEIYAIDNLTEFCKVHNLERTNFRNVLKGKRETCRGWKVFK